MKTIRNRLSKADYQQGQTIVAGLSLTGAEVRAIRDGRVSLIGSYVRTDREELWLIGLKLQLPEGADDRQRQKLLVTARQHQQLTADSRGSGQTIVPIELQLGHHIKVLIAPVKGRRKADKRQVLKQRDQSREIARRLKYRS